MRKIIHVDMDCFFAAIEMRDDPALRGKAIAVGGSPEGRGVISTANYEARRFGVHSAMASAHALRLCPHLIILPGRMNVYRQESQTIREIFAEFTDRIEPLSIDEAFLDVSDTDHFRGSATLIASEIRRRVKAATGLTASAGVAPNKFLAKVASDFEKPDGLTVVIPDQVDAFVRALKVENIPGVGKVTAERLHRLGFQTCEDLQALSLGEMLRLFSSRGRRLYDLCRGIDHRPVRMERIPKSVSVENTYAQDLQTPQDCIDRIPELINSLQRRIERKKNRPPIKALFVKVKFSDFRQTTLERSEFQTPDEEVYASMMREALERHTLGVRLLGLGVRLDADAVDQPRQLDLFYDGFPS